MRNDKFTKRLAVTLTEKELLGIQDEAVAVNKEIDVLEMQKKRLGAKIKERDERMQELFTLMDVKSENREVDCQWFYDWAKGEKIVRRLDTFEQVGDPELIQEKERQQHLFETGEVTPGGYSDDDRLTETDEKARMPYVAPSNEVAKQEEAAQFTCDICQDLGQFRNAAGEVWYCSCDFGKSEASEALNEVSGRVPENLIKLPTVSDSPESETQPVLSLTDEPQPDLFAIDKNRNCCMPRDRAFITMDGIKYLYCTKCLLIHRKQDPETDEDIAFIVGEKIVLPNTEPSPDFDAEWPLKDGPSPEAA